MADKVVRRFSLLGNSEPVAAETDERVRLLTDREKEIARLVGEGKSNREIAGELFLSEGTVRNHLSSILAKTGLRDRTQLAIFAIKNNMVS